MTELPVHHFRGRDGAALAYREMGQGRPLVLIHGYFSTGIDMWVRHGHAAAIAARGHRVILPDLRGHGDSARPHDAAAYPPDVLTDDGLALVEQLGLTDYDLGGYSLGGRTTIRMLTRGATPKRAIVAGQGLASLLPEGRQKNSALYRRVLARLGTFEPGSLEWKAEAFLRRIGGDPVALLHVLGSSAETSPEDLASIGIPTLVVTGDEDDRNRSAEALAAALGNGRHVAVPGNHTTAVTNPEKLGAIIADFLDEAPR